MDVVYPLKEGGSHEEFRYSLRSLRNLPHGQVWTVGARPEWARSVRHIPTVQTGTKYENTRNNLLAACEHPEVSDPFILFNDDFFVVSPIEEIPVLNRGPARDVINNLIRRVGNSSYVEGLTQTVNRLKSLGYENPLSFDLHVPMVVHKQILVKTIQIGQGIPVWHRRTAYGSLAFMQGETIEDVKIQDRHLLPHNKIFWSTSDDAFRSGRVGLELQRRFAEPSPYEL